MIDARLRWGSHISFLCARLRKMVYKFVQLRNVLPPHLLRMVFLALVQSITEYGIICWGGCSATVLHPLVMLHKKIIKICLKRPIQYPTELIYKEFKILKIEDLYNFNLIKYVYTWKNEFPIAPDHGHSTRGFSRGVLEELRYHTSAAASHVSRRGPRLFNKLPGTITRLNVFGSFLRSVRLLIESSSN